MAASKSQKLPVRCHKSTKNRRTPKTCFFVGSCDNFRVMKAKGTFSVQLAPMDGYAEGKDGMNMGRMSIDKTFSGELEATSKGEMLSCRTTTDGSAGYVALEQVTGILVGKGGSFVLQHFGIMSGTEHRLVLEVVPDSGTGELTGLSGSMTIDIVEGEHQYVFDFSV